MRTRRAAFRLGVKAITLCVLACGEPESPANEPHQVALSITLGDVLALDVVSVDAAIWDVSDGGIGVGTELTRRTLNLFDSSAFVRFFAPASASTIDVECTAFNLSAEPIGHGVALNVPLVAGQTDVPCPIVSVSESGQPIRTDIWIDDSHTYDVVEVSPDPMSCSNGDDVDYDVTVSDPQDESFTFYATGGADEVTMPGEATEPLGGLVALADQSASSTGTAYTVTIHYDGMVVGSTPTNLWVIDPVTDRGAVVRNNTTCAIVGLHSVTMLPVAYFYDGTTFVFDVTYSTDGADLTWSCDNDLDGTVDETDTITDRNLLTARATGADTFDLIITDGNEGSPTVEKISVDCSP